MYGTIKPVELQCEHRVNPLGIREAVPRLSWRLASGREGLRDQAQTAWQILAASSLEELARDEGSLWDSGKQPDDRTLVDYAGARLASMKRVFWKVRVWDEADVCSEWSETARWSVGLLDTWGQSEWVGNWIGFDATQEMREAGLSDARRARARTQSVPWVRARMSTTRMRALPPFDAHVAVAQPPTDTEMAEAFPLTAWFRRSFYFDPAGGTLEAAVLWLVPDMVCEVWVNGQLVTTVARWEIAREIDVSRHLQSGENVVGLRITQNDGYPPAVCGELELSFSNRPLQRITFDQQTRFAERAEEGWSRPNFQANGWQPVKVTPLPPWEMWENATHWYAPPAHLRKTFAIDAQLRHATLYATALGIYEVEINGAKVGRDHFAPGWTHYPRRVQVQTYEVTELLAAGENAIGILLGDGWFAGNMGHLGHKYSYGAYPRARLMLVLEYADGRVAKLGTDSTWKGSFGPLRYADFQQGCGYDLRACLPGWSRGGFDDAGWSAVASGLRPLQPAGVPPLAHFILEGASNDPVQEIEELKAISLTKLESGTWVVDFGQNFVGWVRFRVRGESGDHIVIRHGEILNPNGTIYTSSLRGAAATDEYWLKGEGEESLEPKFTFHGFRYAEIYGLRHEPVLQDFAGIVVHSPMKRTGWFECSNEKLNRLYANALWGHRGNYLDVPTDCPQRDERLGWSGDAQFFARTAAYNYDIRAFLERWLVTMIEDSQAADGTFPSVVPVVPARRGRVSTAWGDAAILCAHTLWLHDGDTRQIARHYDQLSRYIDFLQARARKGIVLIGGYGDWLHKGGTAKTEVIDTAYFAHLCQLMAEMGEAIDRPADAQRFAQLHQEIRAAFIREFVAPDGSIVESSQTGYALAFTMGLVPEALAEKCSAQFEHSIQAFDWHLATGFIGTPRLLPGLFNAKLAGTAWRVLMQESYPSWLYQVNLGATTMWERWDGWTPTEGFQAITMNSFNHYAFGAVGEALYRYVAGIDTEAPGYRRIIIRPHPGGGLTAAKAAYEAPVGRIEAGWKISGDELQLEVKIPVNTRAKIYFPIRDLAAVREGGRPIRQSSTGVGEQECAFEVGSGHYSFAMPWTGAELAR